MTSINSAGVGANAPAPARRRRGRPWIEIDATGRHGPVTGTINAALGTLAVGALADAAAISPTWTLAAAAAGGGGAVVMAAVRRYSPGALAYRACCWGAVGGWTSWAALYTPWSTESLAALGVGTAGLAMWSPLATRRRRHQDVKKAAAAARQDAANRAAELDRRATGWEARFQRVCNLSVKVIGIEEWLTGCGYDLDVELPSGGASRKSLVPFADSLAADLRLPNGCGVEVLPGAHRRAAILRVATRNALGDHRYRPRDYPMRTVLAGLTVGWLRNGATILADIRQATWMVVGRKRSGKTTLLNGLIGELAECVDTVIWIIDLNAGALGVPWAEAYVEGRAERPAVDWIAGDPKEALLLAQAALAVALDRKRTARKVKRKANVTLMPIGPERPEIVIVIDECAEIMGQTSKHAKLRDTLGEIQRIAGDAAVNEIFSSLRGTSDAIGPDVKSQSAVRISMRVSDDAEIAHVFDWHSGVSASDAPFPGNGFVATPDTDDRPVPFGGPDMLPDQIDECAIAVAGRRPALDQAAQAAINAQIGAGMYDKRWDRAGKLFDDSDQEEPVAVGAAATNGHGPTGQPNVPGVPPLPEGGDGSLEDSENQLAAAEDAVRRAIADKQAGTDPADPAELEAMFAAPARDPRAAAEPVDDGRPDWRTRAVLLLAAAGGMGAGPQALADALRGEGYTTTRQTVSDWLRDEVTRAENGDADALVRQARRGVYVHRDHYQAGHGE